MPNNFHKTSARMVLHPIFGHMCTKDSMAECWPSGVVELISAWNTPLPLLSNALTLTLPVNVLILF